MSALRLRAWWDRGRHSRLPKCCIAWYCFRAHFPQRWKRLERRPYDDRYAYIRCPLCRVRGHLVEQHVCTRACVGVVGAAADAGDRSQS